MARREDAHVRPDHNVVSDVQSAKVIKCAVLVYENISTDADFGPAGSIKWWDQQESLVDRPTGKFSVNKIRISSISSNVKRLSLAVITVARFTFATMAADSGVLLEIIVVLFLAGMSDFPERRRVAHLAHPNPPILEI